MHVRAAVTGVEHAVRADLQFFLQLDQASHLAVARSYADDGLNFAVIGVLEFGSENMIWRHNAFQRGLDNFRGRCGEYIKIEMIAGDALVENLVEQLDLLLERNTLACFDQVLAPNMAELGIMQKQIRKLSALLDEVQPGHALRFALELVRWNTQQLTKHKTGIVEAQRLIKI